MAIPVKSVTAAGPASVVLEILHEEDTVNVKFEMVSNPGIAGMSFKLCYDSSLLSIVSVDETLDSFKSSIINPDGDGFVGYAYAQAKNCKDTGTVFSITFKINRENEKELTYESVYIDEFDACDSNLEDVNTDIKVQFLDKNAQNIQNKQNLQNTPEIIWLFFSIKMPLNKAVSLILWRCNAGNSCRNKLRWYRALYCQFQVP